MFGQYIDEYIGFMSLLLHVWWMSDEKVRSKYAYHFAFLFSRRDKPNVVRARINSYYAFLVYEGYVSAYKIMMSKYVAGGESLYTWVRLYRELLGYQARTKAGRR